MKNLLLCFFVLFLLSYIPFTKQPPPPNSPCLDIEIETEVCILIETRGINEFLTDIGQRESSNRYSIVNRFGYMGKYQFGKSTLRTLKIKVTKDAFLNSPDLQEYAMKQNLLYNKKRLKKYITQYDGKVIHGILITESGLLAAAHLGGSGNVRKFFRNGKVFKDGNGVKITHYMELFSGYTLNL